MTSNKEVAQQLDKKDILASFRYRFFHPENVIYLDGNFKGVIDLKKVPVPST